MVGDPGPRGSRHVAPTQRVRCDQRSQALPGEQRSRFTTRRERHGDMDVVEGIQRAARALRIPVEPYPGAPEPEWILKGELPVCRVDRLAEPGNHVGEIG